MEIDCVMSEVIFKIESATLNDIIRSYVSPPVTPRNSKVLKTKPKQTIQCVICYELQSSSQMSSACCIDKCCKTCFNQHINTTVYSAAYTIPTIKCCLCFKKISSSKWMSDLADPYQYVAKFELNAKALLEIRCASCHSDVSILSEIKRVHLDQSSVIDVFTIYSSESVMIGYLPIRRIERIIRLWIQLLNYQVNVSDFIDQISFFMTRIVNNNKKNYFTEEYINDFNKRIENLVLPKILRHLFIKIIELIYEFDIELYYKLQISLLNKYPMIFPPCCQQPHCYSCKVSHHHNDKTCEEYRSEELIVGGIQSCPSCNVPTIRTEGCCSMTCVCGDYWEWNEDLVFEETSEPQLIANEYFTYRPYIPADCQHPMSYSHYGKENEDELITVKNLIDMFITQLQMT